MDPATAHTGRPDCPHCLADPRRSRSELVAWCVAAVAVVLLAVVFFYGLGSAPATWAAAGGFGLVGVLLCPLVMGGMMWMMMRKH